MGENPIKTKFLPLIKCLIPHKNKNCLITFFYIKYKIPEEPKNLQILSVDACLTPSYPKN